MLTTSRVVAAVAAAAVYTSCVAALPKITRSGRYLYDESGNRFYIKGIAYQPEGLVETHEANVYNEPTDFVDPLSNSTGCARDLPYLKQLGVNTLRVYSVNSTENHDDCMKQLSDAGIYTLLDLSLPQESITREDPVWATNLLNTYLATIDAFSKYDNVLGYNVGNEVVNAANATGAATFLKAATRDVKAYIKEKGYTGLVGYSSIDGNQNYRGPTAAYLACDPSSSNSDATSIDLYGLNAYEFCDGDQFSTAYEGTTKAFSDYNVVAYFSEFGNICGGNARQWSDVPLLFGSQMSDVWSGGIAFSYFPRTSAGSQFGMATISADGTSVTTNEDFKNLADQYGKVSAPNTPTQTNASAASYPTCPAKSQTFLASTTLPPTPNNAACSCLINGLSCHFQANTNNQTELGITIGNVFNAACDLLGKAGGSCDSLAADGEEGKYGIVSQCDAQQKLSYVMALYYESQGKDAQACNFGGVGVTRTVSTSASAVATSCLSDAQGSSIPSAPASSSRSATTSRSPTSTGSSGGDNSAAVALSVNSGVLGGLLVVLVSMVGGAMALF